MSLEPIDNFRGKWGFLSNFYSHKMRCWGHTFKSVEHAFQSAKTLDPDEVQAIINASTPADAKRLGRGCTLRKDWEKIKIPTMLFLLQLKFSNKLMGQLLRETGTRVLIEGNTWGDRYWGICNGHGENNLGKLLMIVRSEI